jgi:hypothetical protein
MARNAENYVRARRGRLIWVNATACRVLAESAPDAERTTPMPAFTVRALAPDEVLSVYPLIREAMPAIGLPAWTEFGRRLTRRRLTGGQLTPGQLTPGQLTGGQLTGRSLTGRRSGNAGIMAAWREGRPFPCGLFCYRVDTTLGQGRVLIAEYFVAVDLLDPKSVLEVLVAELDALGHRLDCNAVRSVVHGGEPEVAGGLAAAGHAPEASLLLKALADGKPPRRVRTQPVCTH